ncbi:hypothetical protein [Desulfovibrio desulfuricans]|uniref:hypothetical protein n=1 Tax=Desulfovibrio desulfuricans TaxID=876 RepID=UPI001C02B657|nr:hypothetical protein [Desulfovibrio desulfuricans]MBT9748621.1 hypothetical protein [Desulfovibrio desulfuricans]
MSVDKTPTGVVYTVTNGTAGQQYPLTFPYIKGADVKAYYVANGKQTVLTYGIQYTVEDQTLTALVALPVGAKLAIYRQTDLTQEIVWKDGQAVYTPDIMKADDKLTLIAQEIAADMSRTVKLTREEEAAGGKPEGVMQNIYGARDAAAASANVASNKAAEAADSAQAASEKADESAASAAASAQSAANAYAASEGMAPRMDAAEAKNTQQDTRLDAAEQGISAISATLIGSVLSITAAEGYVPNGTVPADAAEYTREQFREFYDTYLAGGKLLTCTYAAFTAQVALTGNCAKFALDTAAQKFKVPLLKNGDSITHAASATELGKSVKAGLPNITGTTGGVRSDNPAATTGAFSIPTPGNAGQFAGVGSGGVGYLGTMNFNLSAGNAIYRNDVTTVLDEQIRLRHFVVLASAQNSASLFDWSNYMAGLAGKANLDMDNLTAAGSGKIANYAMPSQRVVAVAVPASTAYTAPAPAPGWFKFSGTSSAINQYLRLSTNNFVLDELSWSSAAGQVLGLIIPARKGDAVRVEYTAPTNLYMGFVFAEGGN